MKIIDEKDKPIKMRMILSCEFRKVEGDEILDRFFHSKMSSGGGGNAIVTDSVDVSAVYKELTDSIVESIDTCFSEMALVGCFPRSRSLDIHVNPYNPLSGSSYVKLPNALKGKRSIINVKNEDDEGMF